MKKISLYLLLFASMLVWPGISLAAITVDFETNPLFGVTNFLPGDTIVRTVTVTNTGSETKDVYIEMVNVVDGGLGPMMTVAVTDPAILFSGTLAELDAANEQFLTSLAPGASKVYTFTLYFLPQAGNEYQLKSLRFDFCVGFAGGQYECDTTPDDDGGSSNGGDGDDDNSSGGGGGTSLRTGSVLGDSAPTPLILGDQVSIIPVGAPNTGTAETMSWFMILGQLLCGIFTLVFLHGSNRQYKRRVD